MNEQSTSNGHRHASDATGAAAATAAANPPAGLPAERLRAVAEDVRQGFPRAMSASELVIIDVDPRHIHAFWYVPVALAEQRRAVLGADSADAPLVLRLTEAEGPAAAKFDIEVLGLQGRYYVDIWGEARRYSAELGFRCRDGSLVLLADAPAVTLPPLGPAADKSWRLQPVAVPPPAAAVVPAPAPVPEPASEPASEPAPAVSPRGSVAAASIAAAAVPPRFPQPPGEPAEPVPDALPVAAAQAPVAAEVAANLSAGAVSPASGPEVTAPEPAAVASGEGGAATASAGHPFPLPPSEPGEYVPDTHGAAPPAALSAEGAPPAGLAIAAMTAGAPAAAMASARGEPEPPAPPPPATFQWMDAEPVRHPFPLPPSEPGEYSPEHQLPGGGPAPSEPAAPAAAPEPGPEQPGGQEGSTEGPAPLPLENTLSLSSFALGRETVELEINAELHIFGRTLPGRELQLFGRKVAVHPDGSFSISRPLPNGALIVSALLAGNGHREE